MRISKWIEDNIDSMVPNPKKMTYKEKMRYRDKFITIAEKKMVQRRHKKHVK